MLDGFRCILFGSVLALISTSALGQTSIAKPENVGAIEERSSVQLGRGTVTDTLRVTGAKARLVTGERVGYSFDAFPGVKRISRRALATMREIPETGLFIVDADYIPVTLMEELKRDGYRLYPNGVLRDADGERATMFVRPETFELVPETLAPPREFFELPAPPSQSEPPYEQGPMDRQYDRQGLFTPMPGLPEPSYWARIKNLTRHVGRRMGDGLIPQAHAASPFPFACFSWHWRWKYRGGFCRDYRAWTDAYAWGPGAGGGCSDPKPHTNIQYIRTYARAASDVDDEYCYNCDQEHAFADHDIGCFWPAHGGGSGYHFIHMVDGTIQVVRSSSWVH